MDTGSRKRRDGYEGSGLHEHRGAVKKARFERSPGRRSRSRSPPRDGGFDGRRNQRQFQRPRYDNRGYDNRGQRNFAQRGRGGRFQGEGRAPRVWTPFDWDAAMRGPFVNYKVFVSSQLVKYDVTPKLAEDQFENYKKEYLQHQIDLLYNNWHSADWFQERYHPTRLTELFAEARNTAPLLAAFYARLYNEGRLDTLSLNEESLSTRVKVPARLAETVGPKYLTPSNIVRLKRGKQTQEDLDKLEKEIEASELIDFELGPDVYPERSLLLLQLPAQMTRADVISYFKPIAGYLKTFLMDPDKLSLHTPFSRTARIVFEDVSAARKAKADLNIEELFKGITVPRGFACTVGQPLGKDMLYKTAPGICREAAVLKEDFQRLGALMALFDAEVRVSANPLAEAPSGGLPDSDDDGLLAKAVDARILYLRYVHNFCYYCAMQYQSQEQLLTRCGVAHCRCRSAVQPPAETKGEGGKREGPDAGSEGSEHEEGQIETSEATVEQAKADGEAKVEEEKKKQEAAVAKAKASSEDDEARAKGEEFLKRQRGRLLRYTTHSGKEVSPEEFTSLRAAAADELTCKKDLDLVLEPIVSALSIPEEKNGNQYVRCVVCTKLFAGESFVRKHICSRHPEKVKSETDKVLSEGLKANYQKDVWRYFYLPFFSLADFGRYLESAHPARTGVKAATLLCELPLPPIRSSARSGPGASFAPASGGGGGGGGGGTLRGSMGQRAGMGSGGRPHHGGGEPAGAAGGAAGADGRKDGESGRGASGPPEAADAAPPQRPRGDYHDVDDVKAPSARPNYATSKDNVYDSDE